MLGKRKKEVCKCAIYRNTRGRSCYEWNESISSSEVVQIMGRLMPVPHKLTSHFSGGLIQNLQEMVNQHRPRITTLSFNNLNDPCNFIKIPIVIRVKEAYDFSAALRDPSVKRRCLSTIFFQNWNNTAVLPEDYFSRLICRSIIYD